MGRFYCVAFVWLFFASSTLAQHLQVSYKTYGSGYSICVIRPTIDNFIYLLNRSESGFRIEMSYYKYFEEGSSGEYISYWNGTTDNFAYANAVNTYSYNLIRNEIRCMIATDMVYPSDAVSNLYRELRPYFVDSRSDNSGYSVNLFSITKNGATYEFYMSISGSLYDIVVIKK